MLDRDHEGLDELDVYMNQLIDKCLNLEQKKLFIYLKELKENEKNFNAD